MTDTTNRVLSIDEVMALEEGARVWVEVGVDPHFNGIHSRDSQGLIDDIGVFTIGGPGHRAGNFRVWSLPQPPTPEEIEANPWRKEGEAQP